MTDEMRDQCSQMTDEELVRAATVDKGTYSDAFRTVADYEMTKRGFSLSGFINTIQMGHNLNSPVEATIEDAVNRLPEEMPIWDAWHFTNCLDQSLFIQKEFQWTTLRFSGLDSEPESYFLQSGLLVKDIVSRFLKLENWREGLENQIHLENWPILEDSDSMDYIKLVSGKLADREIPATVKSLGYRGCACAGGQLKILVPLEMEDRAQAVLSELKKETEHLYDQANALPEQANPDEALPIYRRLAVLAPENVLVYYNLGTILFEAGELKEAADAFSHAAVLGAGDPEHFENCVEYLKEIAETLTEDGDILHTVATFLNQLNADPAEVVAYYEKLLVLSESDALAHVNLGHLYYNDGDQDALAAKHFKRYLELEPDAEDREQIEMILDEIG